MATTYNKIIVVGHLSREPELRYTQTGMAVTTFAVATNHRYKTGDAVQEETCFLDVVVFGRQAETVSDFQLNQDTVIGRASYSTEPILCAFGLTPQGQGPGLQGEFHIVAPVNLRLDLQYLLIERAHRLETGGDDRDEGELHATFPSQISDVRMDERARYPWMAPAHTIFIQHALCHRTARVAHGSTRV